LEGTAELAEIMQRDSSSETAKNESVGRISNLTFIPSGKCSDHSAELVANRRIEELVATIAPNFDWIVIDAPPVLAVTDAVDLARAADAVLLIARVATTPFEVAQRTKAAFGASRVLGFVLNDVKDAPRKGSYNYNYYYSGEPEAGDHGKPRKESGK
jgi:Mrp family chromosome partitioning ATPase